MYHQGVRVGKHLWVIHCSRRAIACCGVLNFLFSLLRISPFWNTKQLISSKLNKWFCQQLIFSPFYSNGCYRMYKFPFVRQQVRKPRRARDIAFVTQKYRTKFLTVAVSGVSSLLDSTIPAGQLLGGSTFVRDEKWAVKDQQSPFSVMYVSFAVLMLPHRTVQSSQPSTSLW